MLKNDISANIINLPGGWIAIKHYGMLFVLDRTKNNQSLKRPRTVLSLITAKPTLRVPEIHNMMIDVTTIYKLLPWTANKDTLASIYTAKSDVENEHYGRSYRNIYKELYSNMESNEINNSKPVSSISALGSITHHSTHISSSESTIKNQGTEKIGKYIWSITKDQKIRKREIREYRIEYKPDENSFFVIAHGYKFGQGVTVYCSKFKEECIEFIDKLTVSVLRKDRSPGDEV